MTRKKVVPLAERKGIAMTAADLTAFGRDYLAGVPLARLAVDYQLNVSQVTRLRNRLGLPRRQARRTVRLTDDAEVAEARRRLDR